MARQTDTAPLGMRLSLAFVAVALSAVALLSVLTAVFAATDVDQLSQAQRAKLSQAMASVLSASRSQAGSWTRTDFRSAMDLADMISADIQVTDAAGGVVRATPGFAARPGPVERLPVMASGHRVGTVTVRFGPGLGAVDSRLRTEFWRAIAGAAGLAALALVVAIAISRRLTRPVERLIEVANAVGGGDRTARVGDLGGATELANPGRDVRRDGRRPGPPGATAPVPGRRTWPMSCGPRSRCCKPTTRRCSTAWSSPPRHSLARCAMRSCGWPGWSTTWKRWRRPRQPLFQLTLADGDLAEMAATAADSLAGRFESSQLALERHLDPAPVRADARWMYQVITNLLSNAAKFTPAGGRVVLSTSLDDGRAALSVADTGVGITADQLPHIFERFWRGSNPTGAAGSGVGLAVVAELVRGHGGEIDVDSTPGHGTVMVLTLPAAWLHSFCSRYLHTATTFEGLFHQHPGQLPCSMTGSAG